MAIIICAVAEPGACAVFSVVLTFSSYAPQKRVRVIFLILGSGGQRARHFVVGIFDLFCCTHQARVSDVVSYFAAFSPWAVPCMVVTEPWFVPGLFGLVAAHVQGCWHGGAFDLGGSNKDFDYSLCNVCPGGFSRNGLVSVACLWQAQHQLLTSFFIVCQKKGLEISLKVASALECPGQCTVWDVLQY